MGRTNILLESNENASFVNINQDKLYLASKIVDMLLAKTMSNAVKKDMPEIFFYTLIVLKQRVSELLESVTVEELKVILEENK